MPSSVSQLVVLQRRLVGGEPHLLAHAPVDRLARRLFARERIVPRLLVAQVERGQLAADARDLAEGVGSGDQRDARQLALEVVGVALAVVGVVEDAIDVVEDVALGDRWPIRRLEPRQRPVGDVLAPPAAVLVVDVVREALGARSVVTEMKSDITVSANAHEIVCSAPMIADNDHLIFCFACS